MADLAAVVVAEAVGGVAELVEIYRKISESESGNE